MNDHERIFEIHPANLAVLMDKLAAMQKRARKLKTDPITIEKLGFKTITITKTMPGGRVVKFEEERILLKVHGETPKLAEAEYIFQAKWEADDCERMAGGYVPETINITEYLCGVAICIRRLGWLSRGAANVDQVSTSSHAWYLIKPVNPADTQRHEYEWWVEKNKLEYQDRDLLQASNALKWAKRLPVKSVANYLYNLGIACRLGYVTHKTQGLVASAINAYTLNLQRADQSMEFLDRWEEANKEALVAEDWERESEQYRNRLRSRGF